MILEQATFTLRPGAERQFEAAVKEAVTAVIPHARGCRSLRLMRGVEQPHSYLLLIEWDSVDDHMIGFRESEWFVRWRELIGPHLAGEPQVQHFETPAVTW